MEGKEVRFGIATSSLWSAATTATSNGSVIAMHDSYTPIGGMVTFVLMLLGEVIFGGVGCGLYGMLLFVIVTVLVGGLMIGQQPRYLGKNIEVKEMKMAMLAILVLPFTILGFTAVAVVTSFGLSGILNAGPHGFSEILYFYASNASNQGSAFAGLTSNTLWYNMSGGIALLIGRYFIIIPTMAIAGSLVAKKIVPTSAGTLPTHGALFGSFLIAVILITGGLTYLPALALGPLVEHLVMTAGTLF
jgi:K+-transporting ATPase ATPase A chain